METIHDLRAKLDAYRLQLNQVVTILVSDPENAQFRQLKTDLDTVIKLTEELVKTKEETDGIGASSEPAIVSGQHGSSNNDHTTSAAADADNSTINAPFQVGQIVEAISGDRPYAAVVTAVSPEAGECTLKYFEFETAVVLPFTEIAKISNGSLSSAQVAPGFVGQVKYAADQRWYDATVDRVTEHGYHVIYSAYGNSEEVPLQYIRAPLLKKERPKDENALIAIPDNLKVKPTDTEEEKARKKKKIKAIKSKNKERTVNAQIDETQHNWKSFVAKGTKSKRPLPGLSALKNEKSIFASSDAADGKVGVVGSGQGMTDYGDRKRHKFSALGEK